MLPSPSSPSLPPEVLAAMAAAGAQDPAAAPQDPAAAAANKKLQEFKKLVFDRRPSSVLAAWVAPELQPYDPKEDEKAAEGKVGEVGGKPAPAGVPAAAEPPTEVVIEGSGSLSAEQIKQLLQQDLNAAQAGEATPAGVPAAAAPVAAPDAGAAAAAAAKAAADQALEQKKLKREMDMLQRAVTLGRWQQVGEFFAALPEKEQKGAYEHFLTVLPRHPQDPNQRIPPNLQEKNRFSFTDAFVLAGLAPGGFEKQQAKLLAPIVQRALADGSVPEELVRLLGLEVNKDEAGRRMDRREAAMLLAALGQEAELGVFLPTATEAETGNDREALNLLARYALAMYAKEQRHVWLETAWQVTQAALAKGEVSEEEKMEALRRAVELAPKVREDLGPAWLSDSFTKRPERGMEIIAAIGGQVAKGFQDKAQDVAYRTAGLELQKTAVEALLEVAPQLAEQWRPTLALLAGGWIAEAAYSYTNSQTSSWGPMMERDDFGNIFWSNRRMGGGGQVVAIEPADVLKAQPSAKWAALLDEALQPHLTTVAAQLWLKVGKHEEAFPYIEKLASINPRKAKQLAEEFLRVWMRNNNPNVNNRTNSYMFMYGFEQRSNGIPLTRSKQERNLEDLARYVERLRQLLPVDGVDGSLLAEAFVAAHSKAEVYRQETIERVFGRASELDPVVLGQLLGTMRANLVSIWRRPDVQDAEKTRRSQQQMIDEVKKGYVTAVEISDEAMAARGRHWALLVAHAAIKHDQNNFARETQRDSKFSEERKVALEEFREAAENYASVVGDYRIDQESTLAHTLWFYAALGACDLGAVDEETVLAKSQLPLIRDALAQLPDGARERHQAMFANQLFTRMSAVKPQMKYRYLQAGFEIVGDHPQAEEAKKVWDYYQDLIRELRLEAVVDGSTAVGTEPFGLRIDIVHSEEIDRESGGFQKYATNQNNQPYAYNYGRPLENYRDRFHDAAIAGLRENFEVLSITFNTEQARPKRKDASGWSRTPYAYMLLKALGPQIDRIPTIQLDFDFLDTSGFTVLPVGTATVAIDASTKSEPRPFEEIVVTQLLDERRVDEGKVTLEIKAKSKGLVPPLESFLDLETPGFVVKKRDDQGAAVIKFSDDESQIESERVWLLAMAPESEGTRPGTFRFGKPSIEGVTPVFQRYNDADLETVPAEIALRGGLRIDNPAWAWVLVGLAGAAFLFWLFFVQSPGKGPAAEGKLLSMPEHVTPFTVLGLLQQIASRPTIEAAQRAKLEADMRRIEACHFGRAEDDSLDLGKIAKEWLRSAS